MFSYQQIFNCDFLKVDLKKFFGDIAVFGTRRVRNNLNALEVPEKINKKHRL